MTKLKEACAAVAFGGSLVLFCMAEYALVEYAVFRPLELSASVSLLLLTLAAVIRLMDAPHGPQATLERDNKGRFTKSERSTLN